ncbi:unnamed protein product [Calicophoron daubneyi]|uniref:Uncharacterized protein n=1 Tax=Calicophoron daubneyi TaxID=300641 RepID=A0AAV2SYI5_CALDB
MENTNSTSHSTILLAHKPTVAPIVTTNKLVYAQLGQSVRLSCEALANPPVSRIFWFRKSVDSQGLNRFHAKNKTLLTRDAITDPNSVTNSTVSRGYRYWFSSALQINSLDHDDAGVYHCVAENTVHESGKQPSNQRTTEVSMLYVYSPLVMRDMRAEISNPPGEPTIAADIPAHVSVGSALKIECKTNDRESPRIIEPSDQPAIYTALLNGPSAPTRLQCIARGKPAPFIRWLHNKVPVNHKIMGEFSTDPMGTGPTMLRTDLDPRIHIEYSVTCVQISAVEFTLESRFDLVWNGPLEVGDEGIYTCQAESPSAMSAFKQIHLKLSYSPKLLHPQIIRQALTSSLPSTTLPARKEKYKGFSNILNDHGSSVDGGEMDYSIVCYFRMNPPPRKMIWEYVSEKTLRKITGSANINASGGARCQHMSQIKPIAMYTGGQHKVTNGNMKAEMLYGKSARSFLQNMAGISLNYSETVVISRLSASTEYVLRPGTYASHVDNGMGCETCYVQIQNRTRPEAPKILPMRNVTHNSAMLIWYTGFDGGYRQKLAVHYTKVKENDKGNSPHLLSTDETTSSSSSSGMLLVNSTPRIPAVHQCLLSGLIPEATYQIVITGENELGRSLPSNTVQFSTGSVEIPQPENISRIDNNLQIHFSPSIALTGYCIRVDRAKLDCSDWVQIYDDCPLREVKNGVGDPNTVQLTNCKVSLNLPEYKPKSEAGPAVTKNSGIIKVVNDADSTRRSDDVNGSTHYSTSPVISFRIYKNNEYAPKAGGNSSNDARFRRVDRGPFQYRVSTCLANQPNMCGPTAEWKESGQLNDEKAKPYSVFAILCICGGVLAFVVLISTMGGIFMAQWRRRTERRRVWVRQCEKGTEKQLFSPTRKVYGKFSWRDENGTRDITSEDVTKVETEETVPLNPLPSTAPSNTVSQVVYQPICTMSSFPTCTSEHTLINPKIIYEVQSPITALPVYSTGPTQPYSTSLGTPMIGPCISITTPDLLVSDVKEGTELKTSPVILISANDLSKLKLTSSVQSDPQHLVLALPTQSSSMQRFTP